MSTLTRLPPGHDIPPLRLIAFIVELAINTMLTSLSFCVTYRLLFRESYHFNLRLTVMNIYMVIPILTFSRSLLVINVMAAEKLFTSHQLDIVYWFFSLALSAIWWVQVPATVERVFATAFYRTYSHWRCHGTLLMIALCWVCPVVAATRVVEVNSSITSIVMVIANIVLILIYCILFKVNFHRYRDHSHLQNLKERYTVFQNMQLFYPLVWTMIIEMVHNVVSLIGVLALIFIVFPCYNLMYHQIVNSFNNIMRGLLLSVYCLPFLIYTRERRRTKFMQQMHTERENVNSLYFKQLQSQW